MKIQRIGAGLIVLLELLFFLGISTLHAQNMEWDVSFSVCDGEEYIYVVDYHKGPGNQEFHYRSGGYSGSFRLWPDRAPTGASIYSEVDWVRVRAGGDTRYAYASEQCNNLPSDRPETYVYLVAVLGGGPATWVCNDHTIVDAAGKVVVTPLQWLPWQPAGDLAIPYTLLILSEYVSPSNCMAYQDGQAISGFYVDWLRYTCLAYLHIDQNCPGEGIWRE